MMMMSSSSRSSSNNELHRTRRLFSGYLQENSGQHPNMLVQGRYGSLRCIACSQLCLRMLRNAVDMGSAL